MSSSTASVRGALLEEIALEAGRGWTRARLVELEREGRRVEGGWPGTLPEARTCVRVHADRVLLASSLPALTPEELGLLTRMTYDEARRCWRAKSDKPA